jgi:hypothetical protein
VSREVIASAVLAADQFGLLALHRYVPERGLTELIERSQRVGDPVRLSLFHVQQCPRCGPAALVSDGLACDRGRTLFADAHGWPDRDLRAGVRARNSETTEPIV